MREKGRVYKYAIRKAILRCLKCFIDKPVTLRDLIEISPDASIRLSDDGDVSNEWNELKNHKYIEAIPGFEGKYCRISEKGLQQLSIEFSQDVFIHGPGAIK